MYQEIERKFLIKKLPSLTDYEAVTYERYFLFINQDIEIRIQKKWDKYEFERKETIHNLSSQKQKFEITQQEFDELKKTALSFIIRKSYHISSHPDITIKIYEWIFEGLKRVEVEFDDEPSAQAFTPPDWFWEEITQSPLWRDSKLIYLSQDEMNQLIWNNS